MFGTLRVGVDVLQPGERVDRVLPVRILVQHDQLAALVDDLAAPLEHRLADGRVAIA